MPDTQISAAPSFIKRAFARFTDYFVWGVLVSFLILTRAKVDSFQHFAIMYGLSYIVYTFLEAWMIFRFKTTPGKKVCGIYVVSAEGGTLTFVDSLKRSWLVVVLGMGCFAPVLSLALPLFHWYDYRKNKIMRWDRICGSTEIMKETTLFDKAFVFVFYASFIFFYGFGVYHAYKVQQVVVEFRTPDQILIAAYAEKIKPLLRQSLTEEHLSDANKLEKVKSDVVLIKKAAEEYKSAYAKMRETTLHKIDAVDDPEKKQKFRYELDEQSQRMDMFWFIQDLRLAMIDGSLAFFDSLHRQYGFKDGKPQFDDPDLKLQYEVYIEQLKKLVNSD